MKKRLLTTSLITLTFLATNYGFTQTTSGIEQQESLMEHWNSGMANVKALSGISTSEFNTFTRFYESALSSERMAFLNNIRIGKITFSNVASAQADLETEWNTRFKEFTKIEKDYPSTVAEYNNANRATTSCNPSPTNIDFEAGTLNGWNAYHASNNSTPSAFNITGIIGGAAGAVTKAGGPDLDSTDYQLKIMSGTAVDPIDPSIPIVSPYGGHYSVRLGDTTRAGSQLAILSQQFTVTTSSHYLNYQFAILIENPAGHTYYQQPFFRVTMLDQLGDTIPCSSYFVDGDSHLPGYKVIYFNHNADSIYCLNWTPNFVNLSKYIGQCITLQFMTADCALGAHFCYAYVDASTSSVGIISSSPDICGQKTITLTGPPNLGYYKWTGPGIVGSDSTQSINVDSAGNYTLVMTPFGGHACDDTLSYYVGISSSPPPHPDFTAATICAGQPVSFTNISNPIAGCSFYWDFYNLGSYQDSTKNPTWTYASPGTYTVKLFEVHNGCGADTLINITVDSSSTASFTNTKGCSGDSISFINASTGAKNYTWYFGDPASGSSDTSQLASPSHSFTSAGTHTVTLIATNGGPCPDTLKQLVNVLSKPVATITGNDTICLGDSAHFKANAVGATAYSWIGGVSCPTCAATASAPATTTTYTLMTSNGYCIADTTWTVFVKECVTGINNITHLLNVEAYPTFTSNEINLEFAQPVQNVQYIIINTLGQKSGTGTIKGQKAVVNVSNLAQGMYMIRLTDNTGISISDIKFIKQ